MKTSSAAILLLALALTPPHAIAQTAVSLGADISATQAEIQKAEEDDQKVTGGLVKSLISLRLATLRQTLALLDQRSKAIAARTTLQYTVDGKPFAPPSDAPAQIAAVEKELADTAAKIVKQEAEVARYSGGLVQATAMATLATLRQTQAMLEQKRLALKYGLPQFIGFKDMLPVASAATSENRPRAASPPTVAASGQAAQAVASLSGCMKVVFESFCLGGSISTLPPNPTRKTEQTWLYAGSQTTVVTVVDDRIAGVGRFYTPGTWLTYRNVEGDLVEKYGKGKDLSFFPSYANDSSSRETAISLKKGRAVHSWEQQGFTIQLKWESGENVTLFYFHDELEAKRAAKKKDQY